MAYAVGTLRSLLWYWLQNCDGHGAGSLYESNPSRDAAGSVPTGISALKNVSGEEVVLAPTLLEGLKNEPTT